MNELNQDHYLDAEEELYYFNKLSRVSELFCLFLILAPMIFVSGYPLVFTIVVVLLLILILSITLVDSFLQRNLYLKLLMLSFMGVAVGVLHGDPIPTLCIVVLSFFSILKMQVLEKFIVVIVFFITTFTSFFLFNKVFADGSIKHELIINLASVIALCFGLLVHVYSERVTNNILQANFDHSKNRYDHFVGLANKLARYTPTPVWQKVVLEEKDVSVHNRKRKLTVFFSDIKGFTDLSDSLSAEDLTHFLNTYFESMSKIAKKHGGTIDKFIGDALMVFFGDPDTKGEREDALACVQMAVDMARELAKLRNSWKAMGFEGLHVRMGINTGYCHVGNFGSPTRLSYTAIGREVNMAARIQSVARPDTILISDETYNLIKHKFLCQKGESISLKGFAEPVPVWEIRRHRQGDEIKDAHWVEHDMPGFNLHLDMLHIKQLDKEAIKNMLIKAGRIVDQSIKKDKNML